MKIDTRIAKLLDGQFPSISGVKVTSSESIIENQDQTNKVFGEKWTKYSEEKFNTQEDRIK